MLCFLGWAAGIRTPESRLGRSRELCGSEPQARVCRSSGSPRSGHAQPAGAWAIGSVEAMAGDSSDGIPAVKAESPAERGLRPGTPGPKVPRRRGEQSVNNLLPNTRDQQLLSGTTGHVVNNQRTIFCRIPGIKGVPVRATDTKNPRVQAPALAYEPGGRRFESCRAHQINLQPAIFRLEAVVNNLFATVVIAQLRRHGTSREWPDSAWHVGR